MTYTAEELEHIDAVLTSRLGAASARTAKLERIVSVRRVALDERTSARRHEVIWEGPASVTERLEGVDLEPAPSVSRNRAVCLDAMSESLQQRVSRVMERWAKRSRSYPIVSVRLSGERVAEVHLRRSRKVVLVGMRAGRLLAVYERRSLVQVATIASVAALGVGVSMLAAQQSPPNAAIASLAVALTIALTDAMRGSRTFTNAAR